MANSKFFFVFDVESVGLYGKPFAIGYCVLDANGEEVDSGIMAMPAGLVGGADADMDWVMSNVPPLEITHEDPYQFFADFWKAWTYWKARGAEMYAECAWPVEAFFLADCIAWNVMRKKDAPYPLYDISSFIKAAGADPLETYDRLVTELPVHNPLADSRQSGRLLMESLGIGAKHEPETVPEEPPSPEEELEDLLGEWGQE